MSVRVERFYDDEATSIYTVYVVQASHGEYEFAHVQKHKDGKRVAVKLSREISGYWLEPWQIIEIEQAMMKAIEIMQSPIDK
jgi:hypothetical protein